MILPDVNPLIYAFRTDTPRHATCRAWLVSVLSGDAAFGLSPLALGAVVRITTNRHIYPIPSRPEEAFRFCDYLLSHPQCQIVEPLLGERWLELRDRRLFFLSLRAGQQGGFTNLAGVPRLRGRRQPRKRGTPTNAIHLL